MITPSKNWIRIVFWSIVAIGLGLLVVAVSVSPLTEFLIGASVGCAVYSTIVFALWYTESGDETEFTLATDVTIFRGGCAVVLAGFLVIDQPIGLWAWIPALLFGMAGLLDGLDGYLARKRGIVTRFGARLDIEMDSLLLLVGVTLVVSYSLAPWYFLLVGCLRYLFVAGIVIRRSLQKPVYPLPPRPSRRVLGAFQLLVVFLILTPLFGESVTTLIAISSMVPFCLGFLRDWLLISGRLGSASNSLEAPG